MSLPNYEKSKELGVLTHRLICQANLSARRRLGEAEFKGQKFMIAMGHSSCLASTGVGLDGIHAYNDGLNLRFDRRVFVRLCVVHGLLSPTGGPKLPPRYNQGRKANPAVGAGEAGA